MTIEARQDRVRTAYPLCRSAVPTGELRAGGYLLRFARTEADLRAIQRLRFTIFNEELGEGLDVSWETLHDEDEFDASCHHLMVVDPESDEIVGTYRLMIPPLADARGGFYSATEFDLSSMPEAVLCQGVEVGRACVAAAHRNGRVIHLLWRGLAHYLAWNDKRYIFGCCSVPTLDEAAGWSVFASLEDKGAVAHGSVCDPLPALRCDRPRTERQVEVEMPALFKTYLFLGAKVFSRPALDRAFKVIDFLVVLDTDRMASRLRERFFGSDSWAAAAAG